MKEISYSHKMHCTCACHPLDPLPLECCSHLVVHDQLHLVAYQPFALQVVHSDGACVFCASHALIIPISAESNMRTPEQTLQLPYLFLNLTNLGGNMIDFTDFLL